MWVQTRRAGPTCLLLIFLWFCSSGFAQLPSDESAQLDSITQIAAQKHWQEAALRIATYRQQYPKSVSAAVLQSEILIHLGLATEASGVLQRVLAIHPHSVAALAAYAELSRGLNDKALAEKLLLRCTRYAPQDAAVWKQLGNFYLGESRKEASGAFRRALQIEQDDATSMAGIAASRHQQGDDEGALQDFERAEQRNETARSHDAMVDLLFAGFLFDQNRYAESLQHYERALDRDPSLTQARVGKAKALIHLRKWETAERELRGTAEIEGWRIESLNLLTKVYLEQGKASEAEAAASEAERLSNDLNSEKAARNHIASGLQNAHALEEQKRFAEAVQAYQQVLRDQHDVLAAWMGLGRCQAETGERKEAEATLRHMMELQENSADAHVLLGKLMLREEKTEEARAEFRRARELDPLFSDADLGVAASYMVEQRYAPAIIVLRQAKSLPGAGIEVRLMLTEALYKNGSRNLALQEIEQTIRKYPSNAQAAAMRESLLRAK